MELRIHPPSPPSPVPSYLFIYLFLNFVPKLFPTYSLWNNTDLVFVRTPGTMEEELMLRLSVLPLRLNLDQVCALENRNFLYAGRFVDSSWYRTRRLCMVLVLIFVPSSLPLLLLQYRTRLTFWSPSLPSCNPTSCAWPPSGRPKRPRQPSHLHPTSSCASSLRWWSLLTMM